MTARQFTDWCDRHGVSKWKTVDALGISYTQYYKYRNGHMAIPLTVKMLCDALDRVSEYDEVSAITIDQLAEIMAGK